ncbi:MAG: ABC transporter ATP-binding protein [Candidatus Protistobacter heckmanni]|nr:ABC transporter ATP-binding protein [Candidatus Protistobacter heckmanni]
MTDLLLEIRDLRKSFGAVHATQGVNLTVRKGELHALIGPNGAGKTMLLSQIGGEIRPDAGAILLNGRNITRLSAHKRPASSLARSFQISQVYPEFSAEDNVAMAVQSQIGAGCFNLLRNARRDARLRSPAREILKRIGLGERLDVPASALARGEKRQLELTMALALKTPLLLLDEPMAGMGSEESTRMTALLAELKKEYTIVLVEHDMDAVFALADRITVLVYGKTIFTGTPDEVRMYPEVREAYLGEEGGHA